jgi:hypothetical protein
MYGDTAWRGARAANRRLPAPSTAGTFEQHEASRDPAGDPGDDGLLVTRETKRDWD